MSRDTDKSFFISSPLANKYARLYQQLLSGIVSYKELGNRVIRQIKAAHAFRQVEPVRELSKILINIPVKEYQLIAQYYLVWCECRESKLNVDALESIVDHSQTYKAKAFLSLAGFAELRGDFELELFYLKESLKAEPSVSDYIQAIRATAIVKAIEGFHASSLKDMETLLPLIKHAEPLAYYDFLNSYAVELGESGRKDEARKVIRHVIASPFTFAYQEWQETAQELREPARPSVAVPHIEREPVEVQSIEAHHASKEAKPTLPRRLIPFPPLREAPKPTKPKRVTPQEFDHMTADERAELVLAAVRSGAVKESEYVRLVLALGLLDSGPITKVINLEDEALLNDIISVWCNMIDPEEFASVMSALRDCKDDQRRAEIIDNMITIAFRQSPTSMQTEQEWRMRVERKLPEK